MFTPHHLWIDGTPRKVVSRQYAGAKFLRYVRVAELISQRAAIFVTLRQIPRPGLRPTATDL